MLDVQGQHAKGQAVQSLLLKQCCGRGKVSKVNVDILPAQQRDILKGYSDSEGSRYSRTLPRIATGVAKDSSKVSELASGRRQRDDVLQRCGVRRSCW